MLPKVIRWFISNITVPDPWAIKWWPQEARNELFGLLDHYNVAAFFAGHTHTAMLPTYRAYPIYQVNNAWPDRDGNWIVCYTAN